MSGRNIVFEHYNAAKKALSRGNDVCQRAEELAKETQSSLEAVSALINQITYLRSAIYDQLQVLRTVASQITAEESRLKLEFTTTLKDLDERDHELNDVLGALKTFELPAQLDSVPQHSVGLQTTSTVQSKSLFDFAHEEVVESLKGQLRQSIDDMQEVQENMSRYKASFVERTHDLDEVWNHLPLVPSLVSTDSPAARAGQGDANQHRSASSHHGPASMSAIVRRYTRSQEEHIEEMAKLLLSLTEHYDHSSKLFQAGNTMPLEEIEELQTIVNNDAQQVDDVLLELDDRVLDMEEDVAQVKLHIAQCTTTQMQLAQGFQKFEAFDADHYKESFMTLEGNRIAIVSRLDVLREQLSGLSDHYRAFLFSYDALLLEIERRSVYESTVEKLRKQTEQAIARLAEDESMKREHFIHSHGNSLPEDIWHGIRARPIAHQVLFSEAIFQSPKLPEDLLAASRARLARNR